jgi:hypothetical protein
MLRERGPLPPGGQQSYAVAALNLGRPDHELHTLQLRLDEEGVVDEAMDGLSGFAESNNVVRKTERRGAGLASSQRHPAGS